MITYRKAFQCWWPDYDDHPEGCYKKVMKCLKDMDLAISHCRQTKVCVQAGGHVGMWPIRLAATFERVYTFEPEPVLYQCMLNNLVDSEAQGVITSQLGLGAAPGQVMMRTHPNAGGWRIEEDGTFPINLTSIDTLELQDCDALFLDVEGYEPEVLKGAEQTINRCHPVIHVEELPRSREAIKDWLTVAGYKAIGKMHGDVIYCWGKASA